jgi:hypothetical protein
MQDSFVYPDNPLEMVLVELPNFHKELAVLETITEKWIYFMKQRGNTRFDQCSRFSSLVAGSDSDLRSMNSRIAAG